MSFGGSIDVGGTRLVLSVGNCHVLFMMSWHIAYLVSILLRRTRDCDPTSVTMEAGWAGFNWGRMFAKVPDVLFWTAETPP